MQGSNHLRFRSLEATLNVSIDLFSRICRTRRASAFMLLFLCAGPALSQSVGGLSLDANMNLPDAASLLRGESVVRQTPPDDARESVTDFGWNESGGHAPPPFGANLFEGGFADDREDGVNPDYRVQAGDRVSVRVWGAVQLDQVLTVDAQGNIFVPRVGPVAVGGVQNARLNDTVTRRVRTVFTENVRVYTSLLGAQPVAVFVTGNVRRPGRFGGIPSNSALHFLDRAGGIDPDRGSYRSLSVLRGGKQLASFDLYDFLLDGSQPDLQFQDGDTIVVGQRGGTIAVTGDVAQQSSLELIGSATTGQELMSQVQLRHDVSHAGLSGVRNGRPFSIYVPLVEFTGIALFDGDAVHFRSDLHEQDIVVEIEGSHLGPSRFAVRRDTRLQELLDHISVDPALADIGSISLRRRSIAERQKVSLEDSLRRLESRYLTASSATDAEARIRTSEAQLIGEFVARAREVEPDGRLVVARGDSIADVLLQPGDVVTIPRKSESVLLSGEVIVAQAALWERGMRARDYIERAGGFTDRAATGRLVVLHANGEVETGKNPRIRAGDELIVLPKVTSKNLQLAATIVDILYKVAIATSVALAI